MTVGNDVVDLRDPEAQPGATHPRFDERVFAASEQEALRASGAPNRLRWMLWAAKEAAYKVAKKLDPTVVFSPRRFIVELAPDLRGAVEHDGTRFPVHVDEAPGRIHAVACSADEDEAAVHARVLPLDAEGASPGDAVRALALREIAALLGAPEDELEVRRDGRVPVLERAGETLPVDLSLSHHGGWVAFACDLPEGSAA